jgi:hypothetical protein
MTEPVASAIEPCDHHWISSHQPDFPRAIYWIRQCSFCHAFDGEDLKNQVDAFIRDRLDEDREW